MKPEIMDLFRKEGVTQEEIPTLMEKAQKEKNQVTMKQCIALEIAHRKKLIDSGEGCRKCPRKDMLTVDHVIPKMLLRDFGVDVERTFMPENLIMLCRPCNALKSGHLDFSLPETKIVLLELLEAL